MSLLSPAAERARNQRFVDTHTHIYMSCNVSQ